MDRISTAFPLSEEDISSFEENGYLAAKGLFSLTEMESGKQAAKEMVTQLLNQFENKPTESQVVETTLIARRSTQHSD